MPKRVLLLVTGMTPQIITETIYGLAISPEADRPRWVPNEVHVISTQHGLELIQERLFGKAYFKQLCQDYDLPDILFDETHLHPIVSPTGEVLRDLRTPQDNEYAADTICQWIRQFTQDASTELHVSIAGGRKTMGFYAGYALSIYGRSQDSMSHVLVESHYETLPDFYYPTPESRDIYNQNKMCFDASKAKVWLAHIPFVRLRGFLPESSKLNNTRFSEVVSLINLATQPINVTLQVQTRTISIGDLSCTLPPREFAFYYWFADSLLSEQPIIEAPPKDIDVKSTPDKHIFIKLAEDYLSYYAKNRTEFDDERVNTSLKSGLDRKFFDERNSIIRRKFTQCFGQDLANKIVIKSLVREKGSWKGKKNEYALLLDANQISIIN